MFIYIFSGYLGPGGIHENRKYHNCTGGIAAYIDTKILGQHIFHYGRSREIYMSKHFEHEGLLGTFDTSTTLHLYSFSIRIN